ncbi:hypothetical protein GCM10007989_03910 [Devosia pacifica]|uniref:MmcQ/YjbR family DNA-binding protein n=1 Tax=Devosia pacifica TaxID=1335967 RepID=A0A918VP32_9HYPH|nr:hypothetical protein [Devosia pacifica]GHA12643.1 hypothetical protein GCM10007989_03910 [Devosia pacifica]
MSIDNGPHDLSHIFSRCEKLVQERHLEPVESAQRDGKPALARNGAVFASLIDSDTIALDCPVEQKALLVEISPEIYFETADTEDEPALFVRLSKIDDQELSLRLEDAWSERG